MKKQSRDPIKCLVKLEFHDAGTDTDILARILADTADARDFLKLFLRQAERHADIIARMSARMSVSVSAPWNASLSPQSTPVTAAMHVATTMLAMLSTAQQF